MDEFLKTLNGLVGTGVQTYGAITGRNAAPPAATANLAARADSNSSWQQYLPWIAGGGALLLLVVVLARR